MVAAEYPHDTWLLDEGDSPEVKSICRQYGVKHFTRRGKEVLNTPVGKFTKTKGGNHNSWYQTVGHDYDFVAQIDTDFVPEPTFLMKTLGYFRDPGVAFVGTPQVYGNTADSLVARGAAEQLYNFYGPVLQGLSGMEMSLMIGANHVVRVAALEGVDHYTAHITEDLITGMTLHAKGWKSTYVAEPLAVGEGPFTWEAYFNQQMRWAYGCMDILFRLSPRLLWRMGPRRMVHYFFLMQFYFSGLAMAVSTALLALYFATGVRPANVDLLRFVVLYSLATLGIWMTSVWLSGSTSLGAEKAGCYWPVGLSTWRPGPSTLWLL
jgi:cellulose synthase (UDP-forming)